MAAKLKLCFVAVVFSAIFCCIKAQSQPQVPCLFIFGDSLADNGNNNFIPTLFRSNYFPYGIDFPSGPTGRFTNNQTIVDVVAGLLGFNKSIPPYATARGREILTGINYGSGAAGIRDESGQQLGDRISLSRQIRNFQNTVLQIRTMLGSDQNATINHLKKCLYYVVIGNNDYLNNYFLPIYSSSRRFTTAEYAQVLIYQLARQIRILRTYGAEKLVLLGLPPLGCTPSALANSTDGKTCNQFYNSAVQMFNDRLKSLVDQLNNDVPRVKSTYINSYDIIENIIAISSSLGIRITNKACCESGRNNGDVTCLPLQIPCGNRSEYFFWDKVHPTHKVNSIWGRRSYTAQNASDVYPFDIRRLVQD